MQKFKRTFSILLTLLFLLTATAVFGAEYIQGETAYTLAADQTLEDDLYVIAEEVTIDGTLDGDLFAVANYVRIKGEVKGDVLVLAGGFQLDGKIHDDARVLAISSQINGSIGDDILLAGGGNASGIRFQIGNRSLEQGIRLESAKADGDLILYSIGSTILVDSVIGGDLTGILNQLTLTNSQIEGNGDITITSLTADEQSRLLGAGGLIYRSVSRQDIQPTLTENIEFNQIEPEPINWVEVLRNIIGRMAGYALLGWLLLRFRPKILLEPTFAISNKPFGASWTGFSFAFFFIPLVTIPIVLISGFFWGSFAAFALGGFVFLGLATLWLISPLIAGFWLGQQYSSVPFQGLIIGVGIFSILLEIPLISVIVSFFVMSITLGGILYAYRMRYLVNEELERME